MFYHKYRPKLFKEVIGQDVVVTILKNFLKKNYIPHGYLFAGEKGTGKTTIARIYANAINCVQPQDGEPCGQCRICQLIRENKFLDIVEIDAASHRRIEDVRNIQEHIGFKPLQGKYKVFIIDEAHSLTEEASNALLKTLEEPPAHAIFILATTDPDRIIDTILSRLHRFDFRRVTLPSVVKKLKFIAEREGIDYEEKALYLIAEETGGSFRDAETLLEKIAMAVFPEKITEERASQLLGHLSLDKIINFIELISNKKLEESISMANNIYIQGFDLNIFVKSILKMIRQLILLKIDTNFHKHLELEKSTEVIKKMKNIAEKFSLEQLKKLSRSFLEAEISLKRDLPFPIFFIEFALLEYFHS
ncbi:MAG: DNA polymerase III subunit gamma/tau [Patescibacteria group bacterium]|nr:DNA polymerase III subunit gamma/tau [Patescibacteria group bacterium]